MSITVSLKLSSLLGKRIILSREYEGYPPGSIAVVEEFVSTARGSFFRIVFEKIPTSSEDIEPILLAKIGRMVGPGNSIGRSLTPFFRRGFPPRDFPPKDKRFNLIVT